MSCDLRSLEINVSNECLNTFGMKLKALNKCLIIMTPRSAEQLQGFSLIDRKFEFKTLSNESQEIFLEKKVEFQGHKLTVKSILQENGVLKRALETLGPLGADKVLRLVTEETVQLGGTLPTNTGYYEPRVLEKELWLQLDVLRNPDSYPDKFAVSGMEVNDLAAVVPAGETVQYIDQQNMHNTDFTQDTCSRFIVLSEADAEICFLEFCKKHRERTLHWVQFKNGNLLWKKTHGDPDKLLNYIDTGRTRPDRMCTKKYLESGTCDVSENSIWDLGERAVLVVAEPGMGKSSTTTHVAWNAKSADPTSWVVRINLNDHTSKLQNINTKTINPHSLVKFMCNAAFPKSKYPGLNRRLLKQALRSNGNVTVLMEWFDEICPTLEDKAAVILSKLMKTKVKRVWVTSCPVHKERLEKKLSVNAFSLKELSHRSQVRKS
jgi:hypothetical protein